MGTLTTYAVAILLSLTGSVHFHKQTHHLNQTQRIVQDIRHVFGSHANTAICEAAAESTGQHWHPGQIPRFNPDAVSPTDDHGLFQIHQGLEKYGRRIYRVLFNIKEAYSMSSRGRDWSPWSGTYDKGLCRGLG